ncbi:PspC domain-containing protein [Candidatus Saccharibacteria bacterium TM7i]|nr:PspC domain-containing protein [Candidatus Saccharibacteria bacterium TM7i]
MNEITRIHLAKVPYDIEITAKKQLETYLRALESYTDDQDWLQDIEIRITEILAERSVAANGLVTVDDIKAIRKQLGEPEDFFGEGDIAVGATSSAPVNDGVPRRLYRDPSTAMLGGVLSGIAQYLKISPAWTRLAFIALLFISFGTAAVVYIVLWIALPAATTVAAQLELSGEPVTLASLKEQRKKMGAGETSRAASIAQRVILYGVGTFASIIAAGTLVFTIWAGFGLAFGTSDNSPLASMVPAGVTLWLALGLFVVSGLLLSALFSLIAITCFRKKITKPVGVAVVAIIVAGVVTFGSGVGMVTYQSWQHAEVLNASRHTKTVPLPAEFAQVKSLTIGTLENEKNPRNDFMAYGSVEYIVSDKTPRYELTVDSETAKVAPVITYGENGTATLTFKNNQRTRIGFSQPPVLKVYGPALNELNVQSEAVEYKNAHPQDAFTTTVRGGSLSLMGTYKTVAATAESQVAVSDASIDELTVTLNKGTVDAGVVRALTVTQPEACPAHYGDDVETKMTIRAISGGKILYNGAEKPAATIKGACGSVLVGDDAEEQFYR